MIWGQMIPEGGFAADSSANAQKGTKTFKSMATADLRDDRK